MTRVPLISLDDARLAVDIAALEAGEAVEACASDEVLEFLLRRAQTAARRHDAVASQHERQQPFAATRAPRRAERVIPAHLAPGVLGDVLPLEMAVHLA